MPALAHVVAPGTPFSEILHHPAFEPAHALPLLAAGLWAGQSGGRAGAALVIAVIAGAAAGAGLVALDRPPPWRSLMVFASMLAFGGLCAAAMRPPWPVAAALEAAAGLYQGAVGTLEPFRGGTGDYTADQVIVAALLLPLAAYQIAARARAGWARIAVRVAASWIAAAGILLLAFTARL
jgi:urease accessory protein